jgi:hypothetical protein
MLMMESGTFRAFVGGLFVSLKSMSPGNMRFDSLTVYLILLSLYTIMPKI